MLFTVGSRLLLEGRVFSDDCCLSTGRTWVVAVSSNRLAGCIWLLLLLLVLLYLMIHRKIDMILARATILG